MLSTSVDGSPRIPRGKRGETVQIGRTWRTGHAKATDSGKCRIACASLLNGVEGFRFFYTGFRSPRSVEDMPRCCNPSGVSLRCASAMRQGFGDSQTGASDYAETAVRKLHDESSALPCQHDQVNSSPEAFVAKRCGRMGWFVTGRRSMCP